MVDGQIRPLEIELQVRGMKVHRWVMVYQQPGEGPLPMCEPTHTSSMNARADPAAKKWAKRIAIEGHMALEELRAEVKVKRDAEKLEEEEVALKAEKAAKKAAEEAAKEAAKGLRGSKASLVDEGERGFMGRMADKVMAR